MIIKNCQSQKQAEMESLQNTRITKIVWIGKKMKKYLLEITKMMKKISTNEK